jgi:hypothetical protein
MVLPGDQMEESRRSRPRAEARRAPDEDEDEPRRRARSEEPEGEPWTFAAKVRNDPDGVLKGAFECRVSAQRIRFQQAGKADLKATIPARARYCDGSTFAVELEGREVEFTINEGTLYGGRLARDVARFLKGKGPMPQREDYKVPLWLYVPAVLPLGIMAVTQGGAIWGALGGGLAAGCIAIVRRDEISAALRLVIVLLLTAIGYAIPISIMIAKSSDSGSSQPVASANPAGGGLFQQPRPDGRERAEKEQQELELLAQLAQRQREIQERLERDQRELLNQPPVPVEPIVLAAPKPVMITPPDLPAEKVVKDLPAPVDDVAVGGAGRFLILRLVGLRQLAIFDVNEGKIVKYLPTTEDGVKIAAGMDRLIVVAPVARTLERWNLLTFEKEASVAVPVPGTVETLLMGSASNGPLYVALSGEGVKNQGHDGPRFAGQGCTFLDPLTFKVLPYPVHRYHGMRGRDVRVSADGTLYAGFSDWTGSVSAVLNPEGVTMHHAMNASVGMPGPDGKVIHGYGLYTPDLKSATTAANHDRGTLTLPADHGPYYLAIAVAGNKITQVTVHVADNPRALATVAGLDLSRPPGAVGPSDLSLDKRLHLIPDAKLLVAISDSKDRLVLCRVNLGQR